MNRGFKGIWITKELWLARDINIQEKCLIAEIDSLDCSEDHCFASDKYLMKFMGCSRSVLQRMLKKIKELGYVSVVSFDGRERQMRSNLKVAVKEKNNDVPKSGQHTSQKWDSTRPKSGTQSVKGREKVKKTTTARSSNSSTSFKDEGEEVNEVAENMRSAGVNENTIKRAMKYSIKDIDDALHNLSFKDICGDVSGYFFDQLKNIKEYGRRKDLAEAREEVAKENKSFTIKNLKQFEGRQLGIAKATELRIGKTYVEFVLNANCPSKVFEYLSPKFKVDVVSYLDKIGEVFEYKPKTT